MTNEKITHAELPDRMAADEQTEYPYKPKVIGPAILGLLVFGGISAAWARLALTNGRGLILNGIFHFGTFGANVFYWFLAAGSAGIAVLSTLGLVSSLLAKSDSFIRLTSTELHIPQGFLKRNHVVPYSEMGQVKLHQLQGQRFLVILHGPKKVTISQSAMPDNAAFENVCRILAARTRKTAR